jgi:peptide/nickel transport system permease protein
MALYLVRRLLHGVLVVAAVTFFAYGGIRALRPDRYGGEPWLSGTWGDVSGVLLHFDFGDTCVAPQCTTVVDLWRQGVIVDLTLPAGSLVLGILVGTQLGTWSAARRGTLPAKVVEALAMLFYCLPPYLAGYLALLAFDPFFGVLPVPFLVDPNRFGEPFDGLGGYLRGMILPWLIVAAPVAAACLRLTLAMTSEVLEEDYMRTALAKGLRYRVAVRRHAGPAARASVASYAGASVAGLILNVVLVEFVFALPGFFKYTWRAFGKAPGLPQAIDYQMLQAIAVWAAVVIALFSLLADLALHRLDPRVRASGPVG